MVVPRVQKMLQICVRIVGQDFAPFVPLTRIRLDHATAKSLGLHFVDAPNHTARRLHLVPWWLV